MNRRQWLIGTGTTAAFGGGATLLTLSGMGSSWDYAASIAPLRATLADPARQLDLIRYATLAPNGHNTQPWRFRLSDKRIDILPDFTRRTPVVDPDDHHVFVSLGAAAENLALASAARGRPGRVRFNPSDGGTVVFDSDGGPAMRSVLFDAIPRRQSTRADYDGRAVSASDLEVLARAAAVPGVDLVLLTDRPRIDRLRDLVVAGNSTQMADAAFVRELKSWLRFNPRQALRTGDGLYSAASGSPALPGGLGVHVFDWFSTAAAEKRHLCPPDSLVRRDGGVRRRWRKPAQWVAVGLGKGGGDIPVTAAPHCEVDAAVFMWPEMCCVSSLQAVIRREQRRNADAAK